jgi:hypothetical protein
LFRYVQITNSLCDYVQRPHRLVCLAYFLVSSPQTVIATSVYIRFFVPASQVALLRRVANCRYLNLADLLAVSGSAALFSFPLPRCLVSGYRPCFRAALYFYRAPQRTYAPCNGCFCPCKLGPIRRAFFLPTTFLGVLSLTITVSFKTRPHSLVNGLPRRPLVQFF